MTISIKLLQKGDEEVLENVAADVFDHAINEQWSNAFLNSSHHHLVVALDGKVVVGMATAVHYYHPDKAPALWLNEVGVASSYRRQGLGKQMLTALFKEGQRHGCQEAWILTERSNPDAMRFYESFHNVDQPDDSVMYTFYL